MTAPFFGKNMVNQPKTKEEYIDLVQQAMFEVDDLRMRAEDDLEEMDRYIPFVDQLEAQLRKLYEDLSQSNEIVPQQTDLNFMAIVEKWGEHIPFKQLLELINATHHNGLAK